MNRRKFLTKAALGVAVAPVVVKAATEATALGINDLIRAVYELHRYREHHNVPRDTIEILYNLHTWKPEKIQFDIPGSGW